MQSWEAELLPAECYGNGLNVRFSNCILNVKKDKRKQHGGVFLDGRTDSKEHETVSNLQT